MRDERERGWRRKKTRMTKEERIKENRDWKQRKKDREKSRNNNQSEKTENKVETG